MNYFLTLVHSGTCTLFRRSSRVFATCAASCFAFLALFLRFARSGSRLFDSLSANSYGIYLVHYAYVNWLQYALLPASLPAVVKWAIVFTSALGLSWATVAWMRRIPAIARVV
ncbi:MAG: acyltransferase family protein [Terracidiphilus sp.]